MTFICGGSKLYRVVYQASEKLAIVMRAAPALVFCALHGATGVELDE